MSWADDLIIMSQSRAGLHKCLRNLEKYCHTWGLSINSDKSKTMIMELGSSRRAPDNRSQHLNGEELEEVQHFKYLGYILEKMATSKEI